MKQVTFGAVRNPEWMALTSGALAAYCLGKGLAPRQVRNTPQLLEDFQRTLTALGFVLHWPEEPRLTPRIRIDKLVGI